MALKQTALYAKTIQVSIFAILGTTVQNSKLKEQGLGLNLDCGHLSMYAEWDK